MYPGYIETSNLPGLPRACEHQTSRILVCGSSEEFSTGDSGLHFFFKGRPTAFLVLLAAAARARRIGLVLRPVAWVIGFGCSSRQLVEHYGLLWVGGDASTTGTVIKLRGGIMTVVVVERTHQTFLT